MEQRIVFNNFLKSGDGCIWPNETSRDVETLDAFKSRIDCHLFGVVIGMD